MSDQHFEPGPVPYTQELDEQTEALHHLIARLIEAAKIAGDDIREYEVSLGGQTDGTGFLKVAVEFPQGFGFYVHRINLTAMNPISGLPYTPATPYTAGWVGIFRGDPSPLLDNLIDFAPPSPGGNVFPQISVDGNKQAAVIRGERLFLQVSGGPANARVMGTILGRLVRL